MATKDITVDGNLTNNTDPELTDRLLWIDSAGTLQDITPDNLLKVVDKLTQDSTPDPATDFILTYDASATAPKKVALGYVKQEVLVGGFAYTSPADSTTYYFGIWDSLALATFSDLRRIYVMQTGTITAVSLFFHVVAGGSVGSNETSTLWIRKNDTTDYTVTTTLDFSSVRYSAFVTGLSIPVTAGDYIVFKWTTPAWTTNPTNVTGYARALLVGV